MQSTPSSPIALRPILILPASYNLQTGHPSSLFLKAFHQNPICMFLLSYIPLAQSISSFSLASNNMWRVVLIVMFFNMQFFLVPCYFLIHKVFLSAASSKYLQSMLFFWCESPNSILIPNNMVKV
jgi:hypothetical protein